MGAEGLSKLPLLVALQDRPTALLWAGLAASAFGEQMFVVVLGWVAADAFGNAAGYLTAFQAAAALAATLLLSHRTDGMNPIGVMTFTLFARAAALAVAAGAWLMAGTPPAWALALCVAVLAGGVSVFRPAMQASLPALSPSVALLPAVNALLDTTDRIARLLGPGLVSLASAWVALVHFVTLDVICFTAAAFALLTVRRIRPIPAIPALRRRPIESLLRGGRVVLAHPELGFLLRWWGIVNGAWFAAFFVGLPLMIQAIHPGPAGIADFGLVLSSYGGVNLLTTLVIGSRPLPRRPGVIIFAGNLCLGIGIIGLGLAGLAAPPAWQVPAFCLAAAFASMGGPMQDITMATLRQIQIPRPDLPSAVRAFMAVNALGTLITLLAAPTLFDAIGVPTAIILGGLLYGAVGVAGVWRFRHLPDPATLPRPSGGPA